ncbi:TonB-dependent receptor [Alteromonas sp. C1M14]|uniref:TonB-dependent receptor n=1 Tax=Alteromonas sp. C1M14 TaxID=2841567 RepID=UPI001C08D797|nr:TonB-dependent receptor [Alteromonas sp. C1M14]MBU2979782.1 TonB-dependent receptor [Alteromonas sp. C1M14]
MALSSLALIVSYAVNAQEVATSDDIELIEVVGSQQRMPSFNPNDNELSGIFGPGLSAFDVPRSVTSLSAEMIEALNISTIHDIAKIAPNAYASSGFGTPSLPSIRGQLGELFQDGIRRQAGNNGFGLPLSFNSVEQIDVVKGPSPVLFGSTQRNGGFVNLQTKTAPLSGTSGEIALRAGRWDQYSASVDIGTAIEEGKHGIRVSAERLDQGSFFDYASQKSQNVFVAYRYAPSDDSRWDLSAEYYNADYPDIAGINRPTQALIDHNLYITGQGVQSNGSTVPAAGSIISPTGEVVISRSLVYTHPDDINHADTTLLRSKLIHEVNDTVTLRNITYFQYLNREEIATNSFVEIIDGASTFENRTELDFRYNKNQITTLGVSLRYNDVLGYSQFTTEADNPVDLTGPLSNRVIPLTDEQKVRLIELRPNVYVSPGGQYDLDGDGTGDYNLSDTTDSTTWQTGLVLQQRSQWTHRFSTIAGVRIDYYDVTANDPLAPEDVVAASDSHSDTLLSYQLSASYKLSNALNIYAALSENEATSNSMAGGTALGADNLINPLNFATENRLYEVGIKYAPDDNWYAEAALFDQTRSLRNRDGSNSGIKSQGVELQAFYQNDTFWINGSYSYLDARFDDSVSFQDTSQVADAFDNSRPDIIQGTGIGSPSFTTFAASDNRIQGVPEQIVSFNAAWHISEKVLVGASGQYTKSFPLDFLGTVQIRDQINVDVNANYQVSPALSVRLDVLNVTDEENWQPVFEGGYFGATLVMPNLPRHLQASMQYAF